MTTTKNYNCDICRDRIDNCDQGTSCKIGFGLQFTGPSAIKRTPARDAEHHVCIDCLRELYKIGHEIDAIREA